MSQPLHKELNPIKEAANPIVGSTPSKLTGKNGQELLKETLAMMMALQQLHQVAHWNTGDYQLHLLFQRLYESLDAEIDTLAEKIVTLFGPTAITGPENVARMKKWIDDWRNNLINGEKDLQAALKYTYDYLKKTGDLTLGMDDFLMATANNHETNIYLLTRFAG